MSSISLSDMPFKIKMEKSKWKIKYLLPLTFYSTLLLSHLSPSHAEIVDRIVATVNNEVITLSELKERTKKEKRDEEEVLEGMINRVLLLADAKRLGLVGPEEDDYLIIKRLIERRIKAFIMIPLGKAKDFYEKNKEEFKGKDFSEVREEINLYLIEEETNKRLKSYLEELRKKADIRILEH